MRRLDQGSIARAHLGRTHHASPSGREPRRTGPLVHRALPPSAVRGGERPAGFRGRRRRPLRRVGHSGRPRVPARRALAGGREGRQGVRGDERCASGDAGDRPDPRGAQQRRPRPARSRGGPELRHQPIHLPALHGRPRLQWDRRQRRRLRPAHALPARRRQSARRRRLIAHGAHGDQLARRPRHWLRVTHDWRPPMGRGRQPPGLDRRRRPVQLPRLGRRRRGPLRPDPHRSARRHRRLPLAVPREPRRQDSQDRSRHRPRLPLESILGRQPELRALAGLGLRSQESLPVHREARDRPHRPRGGQPRRAPDRRRRLAHLGGAERLRPWRAELWLAVLRGRGPAGPLPAGASAAQRLHDDRDARESECGHGTHPHDEPRLAVARHPRRVPRERRDRRRLLHRLALSQRLPPALLLRRLRSELHQGGDTRCLEPPGERGELRGVRGRAGGPRHRSVDRRRPLRLDHREPGAADPLDQHRRQLEPDRLRRGYARVRLGSARGRVLERGELRPRWRSGDVGVELRRRAGLESGESVAHLRHRGLLLGGPHRDRRPRRRGTRHGVGARHQHGRVPDLAGARRVQPRQRRSRWCLGRKRDRAHGQRERAGADPERLRLAGVGRRGVRARSGGLRDAGGDHPQFAPSTTSCSRSRARITTRATSRCVTTRVREP